MRGASKKQKELEKLVKAVDAKGQYKVEHSKNVAKLAKKHGKAVIAFSGCVTDDARLTNEHGIDAFFPIVRCPCTLVDAMNEDTAYKNLADTAEQVFRIIKIMKI